MIEEKTPNKAEEATPLRLVPRLGRWPTKKMKRLIAAITSALGLSASAAPETKTLAPDTIYFSLATLNDALPAVDPSTKPSGKDLVLHEDDWRQFEAVSRTFDAQIGAEIADVQNIFKDHSKISGEYRIFSKLHVRKRIGHPLSTPIVWTDLLAASGVKESSVSRVGLRDGQGVVQGGFSFQIGQLTVFGIRDQEKVQTLCFESGDTPSLTDDEARRFADFLEKCRVVIVHWPSAMVLNDKQALMTFLKQKKGLEAGAASGDKPSN